MVFFVDGVDGFLSAGAVITAGEGYELSFC